MFGDIETKLNKKLKNEVFKKSTFKDVLCFNFLKISLI